ncbi:MAG: right-handed parallel beta-helix repeat-containing protein, partial [Deltaproteobacteria bacterium]|nr:right-handed parallel beta-helix repeat-containing protein [Deltaproteobacteria bacterium]
HITIAANPGDVVIIDDEGNTPEWEGAFQAEGKAFFDIYDIEIRHGGFYGFFIFSEAHHFTIEGCRTDDTNSSGIYVYGAYGDYCHDFVIRNNHIVYPNQGTNAVYGSRLFASQEAISLHTAHDFVVEGNEVQQGNKEGIDAKGQSYNGIIRNNYIHDFPDKTQDRLDRGDDLYPGIPGIYMDGSSNMEVYGNFIRRTIYGIAVSSEAAVDIENISIHDNDMAQGPHRGPDQSPDMSHGILMSWIDAYGYANKSGITVEDNDVEATIMFFCGEHPEYVHSLHITNNRLFGGNSALVDFRYGEPTDDYVENGNAEASGSLPANPNWP